MISGASYSVLCPNSDGNLGPPGPHGIPDVLYQEASNVRCKVARVHVPPYICDGARASCHGWEAKDKRASRC